MPEVACYCGGLFVFDAAAAACPRCGMLATIPTADTEVGQDSPARHAVDTRGILLEADLIRPFRRGDAGLARR